MLRRRFFMLAASLAACAFLPAAAANRVLFVYPFAVSGAVPGELGAEVAEKIAREITDLGGINVVRGAPAAKPADYRAAARAAGADVYFSGSIAPVGTGFSAIERLVSTRSGTVVWAATVSFRTLADVTGEGGRVHDELLRGQPTPPPGAAPAGVSLITPAPTNGFAVLPVAGSATEADRTLALRAILESLQKRGNKATAVVSATAVPESAAICTSSGARTLVVGTLDTTRVATNGATPQTTAHLALQTYDCVARALNLQPTVVNHIAPAGDDAVRGAVEDAVSAFPSPS
jgi:TolB-like protein